MRPIINKDDELIKKYLEVREQLISKLRSSNTRRVDKETTEHIINFIVKEGKIDSLIYEYDEDITHSNLNSKKERRLLLGFDPVLEVVEYNYIAHDHRAGTVSFETEEERNEFLKNDSEEHDYDAFATYELCEIKELNGTLVDNYDDIISKYEDGYNIFIKSDSVYSNNIKIGYIK